MALQRQSSQINIHNKILVIYKREEELIYVQILKSLLRSKLKIEFENYINMSDLERILEKSELSRNQIWVFFEKYELQNELNDYINYAKKRGINWIFSNMAIEYWFLLHIKPEKYFHPMNKDNLIERLKTYGYDNSDNAKLTQSLGNIIKQVIHHLEIIEDEAKKNYRK